MSLFSSPVHPVLVHFPLAMLTAAWVCLLLRHATGGVKWKERERLFETVGLWTLPLAIFGGLVDTRGISPITSPRFDQPLLWHIVAATAGCAVFAARVVCARRPVPAGRSGRRATTDVVLATTALWLLVLAGAIAGEMVYAA